MRGAPGAVLDTWWVGATDSPPIDPLVAVVAVVALALVLGGVALWYRHRVQSTGANFRRRLADVDEIAVLMHPRPDPDAMASAIAVAHVAEHAGTKATVQYPGQIRHPENRAFRTVLDLDMERIQDAQDLASDAVVLVDHGRPRGFDGAAEVSPYAIVDHHPGEADDAGFVDLRPEMGACSSILAEYVEELDAERVGSDHGTVPAERLTLPPDVATGLAFGILTDTRNLTRGCSSADFAAMDFLYPSVDEELLDRIANPEVDAEVLEVQSRAIAERDQRPPFAISDVGDVENLGAIPQAADELVHLEGVTVVVVIGEKDGTLHFSGRSRDDRVHVGRALETAIEGIPMAGAGGHAQMGGGQVSLAHMEGLRPGSGITREEFHERLFDAISGDE